MAENKAYYEAERKIEEALRTGNVQLDLDGKNFSQHERLTKIPTSIYKLKNLENLSLINNQLTILPDSLGEFTKLKLLFLANNKLSKIPDLRKLTQLVVLHLGSNQLSELPKSILEIRKLNSLDISSNFLRGLPENLGKLSNLKELTISNNQLKKLPDSLGYLKELEKLFAWDNNLKTLPNSIGELSKLQELWLTNNNLTYIPPSIKKIKHLNNLLLHDNNHLNIPNEVLGRSTRDSNFHSKPRTSPIEILDYYFSTQGKQGTALRELKLLVVGRGSVGKTSLIKRLNGDLFDPNESETHGINISPLTLDCHDGEVTARIWDFGGQHVLHAMHEFFLTARSLYLLVLGEREDMAERDAAYWLQLIRSYAGNAPVVIAINKSKGQIREMDRESLERNLIHPMNIGHLEKGVFSTP